MVTFGSRQSESYLCVYDKRMEELSKGHETLMPWVRCELELKKERAELASSYLAVLPIEEWREFAVGLLKTCISFRDTAPDDVRRSEGLVFTRDGTHRCRIDSCGRAGVGRRPPP